MIDNGWAQKNRRAMEGHLLAIKKDETEQDGKEGQLVYHPSSPSIRALGVRVAKERSVHLGPVGRIGTRKRGMGFENVELACALAVFG